MSDTLVEVLDPQGHVTIALNGTTGRIKAGGPAESGRLELCALGNTNSTVALDGQNGHVRLGGNGQDGDLRLCPSADAVNGTIHLDGSAGNLRVNENVQARTVNVGGSQQPGAAIYESGDLKVFSGGFQSKDSIHLDGASGNLRVDGYIEAGDVRVRGDIRFVGAADCAEDFDLAEIVDSGTVMVIDEEGILSQCREAYDSRVAGVVAGAGEYRSGIILDQRPDRAPYGKRMPIALMGKVYCRVDARYAPIRAGDLLTTSATPGCAMKASDRAKAVGTIIGKALGPLTAGEGLIPILVGLR